MEGSLVAAAFTVTFILGKGPCSVHFGLGMSEDLCIACAAAAPNSERLASPVKHFLSYPLNQK